MRKLHIILLIFGISLASASAGIAYTLPQKHAVLQADTSGTVDVRHFDANTLKNYTKEKEFRYTEPKQGISWWESFWRWFWNWLAGLFKFKHLPGNLFARIMIILWRIIEILVLLGGIAAFVYFILKAAGVDMRYIFRKDPASVIPHFESDENINTINFDSDIEKAVDTGNYRLAVRLLYLKCLKQLSDKGYIEWKIDKTNHAYIGELTNDSHRAAFSLLTRRFEYIWYGEFIIDSQSYRDVSLAFNHFNQQVL
jgi:hypothetical protein